MDIEFARNEASGIGGILYNFNYLHLYIYILKIITTGNTISHEIQLFDIKFNSYEKANQLINYIKEQQDPIKYLTKKNIILSEHNSIFFKLCSHGGDRFGNNLFALFRTLTFLYKNYHNKDYLFIITKQGRPRLQSFIKIYIS